MKKTTEDRIGDRSWKSPRKRLHTILLVGFVLLLGVQVSCQYQSFLQSFTQKKVDTFVTTQSYKILVIKN